MVHYDEPPVYCYANWDDATRRLVGADAFPPSDYCNVACAYHMGDPVGTYRRIQASIREGKEICAHPGLDIAVNGRPINAEDVYTYTLCQLGALKALVEGEGGKVGHVKPHGILYVLLRDQAELMRAFLRAQTSVMGKDVAFHGLSQTNHEAVAVEMGVPFVGEILKDKVDLQRTGPVQEISDRPRRPLLSIRQRARTSGRGQSRIAPVPQSTPSPCPSSPSSSASSSSPSSTRTSSDEDAYPRTIAYTLQNSHINGIGTRSNEGILQPTPRNATLGTKAENSAQRLARSFHYWTTTPIPTMIEDHRSTPTRRVSDRRQAEACPNQCETQ